MSPFHRQIVSLSQVPRDDEFRTQTPSILVVDDERIVADTLGAILRQSGFVIRTAYGALDALRIAQRNPPDLLITDVAMPEMNGVELAVELLRSHPACEVLLFSGHADSSDMVIAFEAGHNFRLLTKPLHPTKMLQQIALSLHLPEPHIEKPRMANVIPIRATA
jgi:DNA-binding NtrC family response regulator